MNTASPSISTPNAARLAGLPASYLRRFLVQRPRWPLVRWPGLQPRLSMLDVLRLATLAHLMRAGLTEAAGLAVLDGTVDRRLFGLAHSGVPIPPVAAYGALREAAWHVLPGTPPCVLHVADGPPAFAVCFTFDAGVIARELFDNFNAAVAAKDAA